MPFPPAIPLGGLPGLRFLERTYDQQFEIYNRSPEVAREIDYFEENAGNITSVDDLMSDRRILAVVLGAFGLDEDINKGAFIRKVIEEGTILPDAFANRLVESRYREMSAAIGFGNVSDEFLEKTNRDAILAAYQERQFELAVGDVDFDMRLALNFRREVEDLATSNPTSDTVFLRLLGSEPLRLVTEAALNLPREFGQADLDDQLTVVKRRFEQIFDVETPEDLMADGKIDEIVDRFMIVSQAQSGVIGPGVRGATALTLLQSGTQSFGFGTGAQNNLFASNFV